MSKRVKKVAAGSAALVALALGGAAIANATGGGGGGEQSLSGGTADQAAAAALEAVGGGKVTASELDDEKGATYEVEVTKADGSSVGVRLDKTFAVVAIDGDSERADSSEPGDADDGGQESENQDDAGR